MEWIASGTAANAPVRANADSPQLPLIAVHRPDWRQAFPKVPRREGAHPDHLASVEFVHAAWCKRADKLFAIERFVSMRLCLRVYVVAWERSICSTGGL